MTVAPAAIAFFSASQLSDAQVAAWRGFANTVPWAHYRQDPAWAETERQEGRLSGREPWFFWAEKDGSVCLTAIGIRRRLPVPGYVFWEFNYGPTVLEPAVLDTWLPWLLGRLGRSAARVRVQPPMPLAEGGEDIETLLQRHGFIRQRLHGGWTTLLLDIGADERQIMAGLRNATQRAIKKSRNLGVEVRAEDTPEGWRTIAGLQAELGRRAPVPPLDTQTMERISKHWPRAGAGGTAAASRPDGADGTVLVARHDGKAVAAALVVAYHGTAHLPVIPSSRGNSDAAASGSGGIPAAHLLVWETIRWAKEHGCTTLDFVGYGMEAQPGDAMSGINQFKRGFAPLDNLLSSVAMHEIVRAPAVVALAGAARGAQALLARRGMPPAANAATAAVSGAMKRAITVSEWNIGVADVTLEELVGDRDLDPGSPPKAVRPRVRWLNKPWFIGYQADPCLLEEEGQLYLYYEDVLFGSMKGRLRAGRFDPDHPAPRLGAQMMDLGHHAAYPYVFKHDGVFYCVPDTGEDRFVALYRSDSPSGPWSRHSVLFERLPARDTTIFFFGDRWWLFANVCDGVKSRENADLYIWHGPKPWGPWTAHALAPAKRDVLSARPAGRPFVVDGVLYRPAQDCGPRYGARVAINRVLTLTPVEFAEEVCSYLEPDPDGPYAAGLHTLTCAGGLVIVDGQFEGMTRNLYKTAATAWGKAVHYLRPPNRKTGCHANE